MTGRGLFEMSCDEIIKYFKEFDPDNEYFWYKTSATPPFQLFGISMIPAEADGIRPYRAIEKRVPTFHMANYLIADSMIDFRVDINNTRLGHIRIEWIGKEIVVSKIKC